MLRRNGPVVKSVLRMEGSLWGEDLWKRYRRRGRGIQVNSALHPSGVAKSSTSFGCGKGWDVTCVGWQVTLCGPIWHVSSSSGVATLVSEMLHPCYFTLLYFTVKAL